MSWSAIFAIGLLIALLVPTLVVLLEAPILRRLRGRATGPAGPPSVPGLLEDLTRRVAGLEDDLAEVDRMVQDLRDELDELRQRMNSRGSSDP